MRHTRDVRIRTNFAEGADVTHGVRMKFPIRFVGEINKQSLVYVRRKVLASLTLRDCHQFTLTERPTRGLRWQFNQLRQWKGSPRAFKGSGQTRSGREWILRRIKRQGLMLRVSQELACLCLGVEGRGTEAGYTKGWQRGGNALEMKRVVRGAAARKVKRLSADDKTDWKAAHRELIYDAATLPSLSCCSRFELSTAR